MVTLKPVTVIIVTVSLIIFGMIIVRSSDTFTVDCLCYALEGETCPPCPQSARDAVMTGGFSIVAAGAALVVVTLIAAKKKGNMTEISG